MSKSEKKFFAFWIVFLLSATLVYGVMNIVGKLEQQGMSLTEAFLCGIVLMQGANFFANTVNSMDLLRGEN